MNFCLERLNRVTMSHNKARSNRRCQWPELFRLRPLLSEPSTYRKVNFSNRDNGLKKSCWSQVQQPEANFLYEQSSSSMMTGAYIYSLKTVLEHGPTDQQSKFVTIRTFGAVLNMFWICLVYFFQDLYGASAVSDSRWKFFQSGVVWKKIRYCEKNIFVKNRHYFHKTLHSEKWNSVTW